MNRLPEPFGCLIDRSRPVRFRFDGLAYTGLAGDSIASALAANGVRVLSSSFKHRRPRGIYSAAGHEAGVLVQVNQEPSVAADERAIAEGMTVSRHHKGGRWIERFDRFLPVGFYYRAFFRPAFGWRLWEPIIRRRVGHGRVDPGFAGGEHDKLHLHADVAVVGGGPAGLAAALAAAETGAEVVLLHRRPRLGGGLLWGRPDAAGQHGGDLAAQLGAAVLAEPRIRILTAATVTGCFADRWLSAVQGARLIKLRARALVLASGQREQPAVFRNNDLPGVMLGSAAQRLIRLHGVKPGRRAVVATANDAGYGVALDLEEAGVELAGILDLRPGHPPGDLRQAAAHRGLPILQGRAPVAAEGRDAVQAVLHAGLDEAGGERGRLAADLLCLSVGGTPAAELAVQAGATLAYDPDVAGFRLTGLPEGVFAAGAVDRRFTAQAAEADGKAAGREAARAAGFVPQPMHRPTATAATPNHPFPIFPHPEGKDYVDFDHDVTVADVANALTDGFEHIELLKRYTTLAMGPSQGRLSALNAARLLARARNLPVAAVGAPNPRPPFGEECFGHLAGRGHHPVRRSALHPAHQARGAKFMPAGLWLRPAYYGSDAEVAVRAEVMAVHHDVGLIDVSTLGGFDIRGPDAPEFVERFHTGSFRKLAPGRCRYGLVCDVAGSLIDDGMVCRLAPEHFYVTATTGAADGIYRSMLWWQAQWRLDVDITNLTSALAGISVAGPKARDLLAPLTRDLDVSAAGLPFVGIREGHIADIPVRALRTGFVGEVAFELHVPAGMALALWEMLLTAGERLGVRPFGVEAQRILRLQKGHIIIGQDTDANTTPAEAGLALAVAMAKPYFVGRRALEIRAGQPLERRLVGFTLADPLAAPPSECHLVVRQGDIVGRVTSVAHSPVLNQTIGLAYVAPDQAEPGIAFTIKVRAGRLLNAVVTKPPFYDPAGARQA
ncbi:MAG: FAD-dependent oxidoreductase [Alphaproteobacteria bacterium]|nr:FAD-dependent oxidoreductase [Alphaproteobacteria bacterium]